MAHEMSRSLGRDHKNIDVLRRLDESEMNAEAMRKSEILSSLHRRGDVAFVYSRRELVGDEDHDNLAFFRRLPHGQNAQARFLGLRDGGARALQPYNDVAARI